MAQSLNDFLVSREREGKWTPSKKQIYNWYQGNRFGFARCVSKRKDGLLYISEKLFDQWEKKYQERFGERISCTVQPKKTALVKKPLILEMNNRLFVDLNELTKRLNHLVGEKNV